MAHETGPSGLANGRGRVSKNRWSRAIERRPTAATATVGFMGYMLGALCLMVSVFVIIAGLTMVVGSAGTGLQARVGGVGLLVIGAAVFVVGRWFVEQYSVQRRY